MIDLLMILILSGCVALCIILICCMIAEVVDRLEEERHERDNA